MTYSLRCCTCLLSLCSGPDPKKHSKENMQRIRQIQSQAKKLEQEKRLEQEQRTAIVKSSKYDHVQAKVTVHMRPHSTPPLRHSSTPSHPAPLPPSHSSRHQPSHPSKERSEFHLELPNKAVEFRPVGKGPRNHHSDGTSETDADHSLCVRKSKVRQKMVVCVIN